jgi:uncharacterized repeat protein (TIGR03943 family)
MPNFIVVLVAWLDRWRGVLLGAVVLVATLWLAWSNQLVLYIHPRYIVFTVTMTVIALALVVTSIAMKHPVGRESHGAHDAHDGDIHNPSTVSRLGRLPAFLALGGFVVSALFAITLIIVPPATLTSATADQRAINSSGVGSEVQSVDDAAIATDTAVRQFTVLDWASLLNQTSDAGFYADKPVDVVGFITADTEDPDNMFYVSRFIVTCCAVDAQPVGVPVYLPRWADSFSTDQWVRVSGEFSVNTSRESTQPLVLREAVINTIETPDDPYLF